MKWTVQELQRAKGEPFSFQEVVDVSDIQKLDPEVRHISPVRVSGSAIVENEKASFPLEISGEMVLPCSNTLVDVDYPFHVYTTEVFRLGENHVTAEGDEEVHDTEDGIIDLLPYVKEAILVEKPIRVVSPAADEGEAPQSGKGWEMVSPEKKEKTVDPRLKKLEELLKDDERKK